MFSSAQKHPGSNKAIRNYWATARMEMQVGILSRGGGGSPGKMRTFALQPPWERGSDTKAPWEGSEQTCPGRSYPIKEDCSGLSGEHKRPAAEAGLGLEGLA